MSLKFTVGDLTIHRIIEQETTFLPALEMLPGLTPEVLAENRAWMQKAGALDDNDVLILCFQSYVVKTPHHTILIDSCIGNDKPRPQRPKWNMKTDDTYARAWPPPDFRRRHRLCHVHASACRPCRLEHAARQRPLGADLSEGALRVRQDRVRLLDRNARENAGAAVCDSVLPVVEARQAEIVRDDYAIGDHTRILPTPGHTPGHVAFTFGRGKDDAVFSGDLMHSPLQTRYPGIVRQVRRRSGAGRDDAAPIHGALLRQRHAVLHRAFPLAVGRKDPAQAAMDFPARRYERGHASIRDACDRAGRRACDDRQAQPAGRVQRAQHPDGPRPRALFRGRGARPKEPALHRADRHRRQGVLRRRRPEGAPRHDGRGVDAPARHFRADGAGADRLPGPDHRRRQRRGLWRRLRDRGLLRFPLCGRERALCAHRGDARHHAGRRRHANPAARRRRAPRQGADPDRQAVYRGRSPRLGSCERSFPPPNCLPAALATAARIARNAPISVRQAKLSIHRGLQSSLRDGLALEIEAYNRMVPTEDRREGVLAFNEKRNAELQGRNSVAKWTVPGNASNSSSNRLGV
jgi:glyoxylase-like metal-dependent hydrolase (beta-lactamase superfamily II)